MSLKYSDALARSKAMADKPGSLQEIKKRKRCPRC